MNNEYNTEVETAPLAPKIPTGLPNDERYFLLLVSALRVCASYKPKFGQGRKGGFSVEQFQQLYSADPFYHWLGLDSPLMYAAHKAAGGMTSIYRQIGIGSQWVFSQILQDQLGLTKEQAAWSYQVPAGKSTRTLSLDGRLDLAHIADASQRKMVRRWLKEAANRVLLPPETQIRLKGAVIEARQGYKSKDSKRQNADVSNAANAYVHDYLPVVLLFSTQIDFDVALRYKAAHWLLLNGTTSGTAFDSTYVFCREVLGYDLAAFFERNAPRLREEMNLVLSALLSA